MYEYIFTPDLSKVSIEDYEYETTWFMSTLYKNGQISRDFSNAILVDNCVKYYCEAFEDISLQESLHNEYCIDFLAKVIDLSSVPPAYNKLGEIFDAPQVCDCKSPSHYVLYTAFLGFKSPVSCGDCKKMVPLYRLPKILDEKEYNAVLYWKEEYNACDKLFMNSSVGERFGYKQISNPKSKLTQEGLKICRAFEEKANIPFYYFLYKYYGKHKATCPLCGGVWETTKNGEKSYKCDLCKLIGNAEK